MPDPELGPPSPIGQTETGGVSVAITRTARGGETGGEDYGDLAGTIAN